MAKRILLVDDEPDIVEISTIRFKHLGYEVMTAPDAEAAIEVLKDNMPDLILLDLLLPKMQGEELCKKLKSDERLKHIPIIIFTANAVRSATPDKIKDMGADDCIMKPFAPGELVGKVKKFIG